MAPAVEFHQTWHAGLRIGRRRLNNQSDFNIQNIRGRVESPSGRTA